MMKPKGLFARTIKTIEIVPRNFEQRKRSDDIGLNKIRGAIYRTINMTFSRQMHHRIRLKVRKHRRNRILVANIDFRKTIVR